MEWIKVKNLYDSEEKAIKRLASQPRGAQYEVETTIEQVGEKWQILWRKVFSGHKTGCGGGCNSCHQTSSKQTKTKILPFGKSSDLLDND